MLDLLVIDTGGFQFIIVLTDALVEWAGAGISWVVNACFHGCIHSTHDAKMICGQFVTGLVQPPFSWTCSPLKLWASTPADMTKVSRQWTFIPVVVYTIAICIGKAWIGTELVNTGLVVVR